MTQKTTLTDGSPVTDDHREIDPVTGQQKGYVVLSAEERAKGLVRPVRHSYVHVGIRPAYPTRPLTEEEKTQYVGCNYVVYEKYPDGDRIDGRFWTQEQLSSGCGAVTTMGHILAETYARDPKFYTGTFCATCKKHFALAEFKWDGTDIIVGT